MGKGKSNAKTEIEKLKLEEMTVQEGVREVARIIHSVQFRGRVAKWSSR